MSVTSEDKRCDGLQKYIPFLRTPDCVSKIAEDKRKKDEEDKAKRELTNVTQVETSKLPPVDASTATTKEAPASGSTAETQAPSGLAASGVVADPAKRGGWFSRGGKRKSKAKKSKRKNRKQRKSRKSRKSK